MYSIHANTSVMVCYPKDTDLKMWGQVGQEIRALWKVREKEHTSAYIPTHKHT